MNKMIVTKELVDQAKKLAQDNYETWGHWIVECYDDDEVAENLADFDSLEEWIDIRIRVAEVHRERSLAYDN